MTARKKVALVTSHGGHLAEMLALKDVFRDCEVFYITYEGTTPGNLPRAYFLKPFHNSLAGCMTVWPRVFAILRSERPHAVFSTGAEIALPVFFIAKFFFGCKLAYLECSAQVNTPSLTGRIVYHIADLFLVQWEALLAKYGPRAQFRGGLI